MGNKILALVLVSVPLNLWGSKPWTPKIEFRPKSISFSPAKGHPLASQAKIEVIETEDCDAKIQSANLLQVSDNCEFLRGYYRYSYQPIGSEKRVSVLSEFFVRQTSSKSYIRLTNSPVYIFEG
jgi:hypothetical protein